MGGPIKKDRLFFFVNYEAARQREESSVTRIVPSDLLRQGIVQYRCKTSDPNCAPGNPAIGIANDSQGPGCVVDAGAPQADGSTGHRRKSGNAELTSIPSPNPTTSPRVMA